MKYYFIQETRYSQPIKSKYYVPNIDDIYLSIPFRSFSELLFDLLYSYNYYVPSELSRFEVLYFELDMPFFEYGDELLDYIEEHFDGNYLNYAENVHKINVDETLLQRKLVFIDEINF